MLQDNSFRTHDPQYPDPEHPSQTHPAGIIDTVMEAVISVDEQQRIVLFNPTAVKMFGWAAREILGQPLEVVIPLRFRQVHQAHIREFGETGITTRAMGKLGLLRGLRRDGSEFLVEASISRVTVGDQKIFTAIVRDITERVRAEERQQFLAQASRVHASSLDYSQTLAAIAQLAVPTIADWCTVYLRTETGALELVALTHVNPEKVKWVRELEILHPPDPNETRGVAQVVRSGKPEFLPEIPYAFLEPLAQVPEHAALLAELQLTGAMTVPLVAYGKTLGAITLISAESRRKYTTEDLELAEELAQRAAIAVENARLYRNAQTLNEELERRVQERTAALNEMNQELEAFSYSVSHDLRAPLRHIGGFLELLQKDIGSSLNAQDLRYMNIIADAAKRMGVMIDDLLAFSRVGRTDLNYEWFDMEPLVREVIRTLDQDTQGRNIVWNIQTLPMVFADRALFHLAWANLIGNAIKYTRPRPTAEIEIGSRADTQETLFFIRDNGVGFDMKYVDKLFGVFQRLHSASEFEGTGIGLANVQRVVRRHGGRTWAEGVKDGGATFYFSLPLVVSTDTVKDD